MIIGNIETHITRSAAAAGLHIDYRGLLFYVGMETFQYYIGTRFNHPDPKYWQISDNPKDNTVPCWQVCSISEDLIRATGKKNEFNRPRSCQWDQLV